MKVTSTFGKDQATELLPFTRAIRLLWIVCNRIHIYVFWLPGNYHSIFFICSNLFFYLFVFLLFKTKIVESITRSAFGVQNRMNTMLKIAYPITIKLQLVISNECKLIHSNSIQRALCVGQIESPMGGRWTHKNDIKNDLQLNWNQFQCESLVKREKNSKKLWNTTILIIYRFLFLQLFLFCYSVHIIHIQVW